MKRSLRMKIILVFSAILLVFAAGSTWSIINFNRLSRSIDNIMESNYRSIEVAQNMILFLERQDSVELAYMFSQNADAEAEFNQNQKEFIADLSRAEDNITEPGEREALKKISDHYMIYITYFNELVHLESEQDEISLENYYYQEIFPLFETIRGQCRDLWDINQNAMIKRKDNAHQIALKANASTIAISVSVIIISLILISFLTQRIVRPLFQLIDKIKQISEGNYHQKIEIRGDDEIAQLANEFNLMAQKLVTYDEQSVMNLREEKNKSEAIVNSISDGILVLDHEHRILLLNDKAESIFGVREKEAYHKHLLEIIDNKKLFTLFKAVNDHPYDSAYRKYEDIAMRSKEETIHYKVSVRPVQMKSGNSYGMVALFQDITKFKEIDQMKTDFISSVSHEFRTPLTSITMSVALLLEKRKNDLSESQIELVTAIQEDANRLNNLVTELLDLSKLESGRMQLDFQPHQIADLIKTVKKNFKLQLENIDTKLIMDIPEQLSKVNIDAGKINWVFSNLISNALRYISSDGTGEIKIKVKEIYQKQVISVHDNGSGMDEDTKKKIFGKFIQGKHNVGGAGLGLAICKGIINAHGGDIWVESEVGVGTSFYFTVNVVK